MAVRKKETKNKTEQNRTSAKKRPPVNLVARLAEGETYTAIAESLGVRIQTVSEWAQAPDVQAELQRLQREASDEAARRLRKLAAPALDALNRVLTPGSICRTCERPASAADRDLINASKAVLDKLIPDITKNEVSGGVSMDVSAVSDADLRKEILMAAWHISKEEGETAVAAGLKRMSSGKRGTG